MINVSEAFEKFRRRLELSATEQQDAIRRHHSVRDCIRADFDIGHDFLTGSYARHTKTKPLKDVDIFFCLGNGESHWHDKPPNDVLGAFQKCLADRYGTEHVELGRRCVNVEFEKRNPTADEEGRVLSIDAVPVYDFKDYYEIPDRDISKWIKTDPKIHKEAATAKNKELDGKWVPLVKMLKRWNRSAESSIKPSFLIEVMALDLTDPPFTCYSAEIRRFFASALEGVSQDWPDPAGLGSLVSDQMTPQQREIAIAVLRSAEMSAARAVRLEQQGKTGEALAVWRGVMGKYFPLS